MRLRTSDAQDGEGGNKWQRTGINDGLLTPIAPAADAAPVSSPEDRGRFLLERMFTVLFGSDYFRCATMRTLSIHRNHHGNYIHNDRVCRR